MSKKQTVIRSRARCKHCSGTGRQIDAIETGRRLRAAREKARVGLRELSRKIGCSHTYVGEVEGGTRRPSVEFADRYLRGIS